MPCQEAPAYTRRLLADQAPALRMCSQNRAFMAKQQEGGVVSGLGRRDLREEVLGQILEVTSCDLRRDLRESVKADVE
ncbi:MAG: hypothetical protein M3P48_00150, partial [Actinomycetota bacterium]|nr:hypothetical protein [Actinomycetota bacterium]